MTAPVPVRSEGFGPARRFVPRYGRANRSHCWYTRNWQANLWHDQPTSEGKQSGVTIKRRNRSGMWRHVQFRAMHYGSSERGCGMVHHYEICWHLSNHARSSIGRIKGSKRYFRFKVCL